MPVLTPLETFNRMMGETCVGRIITSVNVTSVHHAVDASVNAAGDFQWYNETCVGRIITTVDVISVGHAQLQKLNQIERSCPQRDELGLSGPPSGQDAGGGARTLDRRVPADLRAESLATVPWTPLSHG
ncbi:hypothetical protein PoB_007613200 [Plakobranchus ocellatus]|uniref:Uncharacterized protein n=1 Tax=Plakobranchus ocellatus TaxID=259542 RepID=A0AAV4E016_9GAST|nr:hypothetical protein PoB_007613200 [Plakobranchus ocellatus]